MLFNFKNSISKINFLEHIQNYKNNCITFNIIYYIQFLISYLYKLLLIFKFNISEFYLIIRTQLF